LWKSKNSIRLKFCRFAALENLYGGGDDDDDDDDDVDINRVC
jgi:hypothetical protein